MVSFYESLDSNAYDFLGESFCVKWAYFYVVTKLHNISNYTYTVVFCVHDLFVNFTAYLYSHAVYTRVLNKRASEQ